MLKNYIKLTWRNLVRSKLFSIINLSGLSVGLACCMLIFLYAKDERSYDRFHQDRDNIYHLTSTITGADGNATKIGIAGMMPGPAFAGEIPEIKSFVRLQQEHYTVRKGGEVFQQQTLAVDSNFLLVFTFPLLQGNPRSALNDPYSVVLTEETAEKYFGKASAMGQTLEVKTDTAFVRLTVTGIAKKAPQNSSIKFGMLVPMSFRKLQGDDREWLNFFLHTFFVLQPGASVKNVEAKMAQSFGRNAAEQLEAAKEKYNFNEKVSFGLQPLLDVHLSKDFKAENGLSDASKPLYAYILSGIALFVFLIACINFVNLTVARSLKRAKEIGIRKVMGSQRRQLILQFLGESFVLSFLAFGLAIGLALLLLPLFNEVSNKALAFSYLFDAKLVLGFIGMFLLTGLLAGFYPALVLSRFNPVETLYGKQRFGSRDWLAKGLVVLQFALATFLIVATLVIYAQFSHLVNFNLGYNDRNLAVVNTGQMTREKAAVLKTELLKNPAIAGVTTDQGGRWNTLAHINGETKIDFAMAVIDEDYFPLLQIPVVKGRNFSPSLSSDTASGVIVNETFAKTAGWKDPLGQVVDFFYNNKKYFVIGVVKDHHYAGLNEKIGPQVFLANPGYNPGALYVKVRPEKTAEALAHLQKTVRQLFPFRPYEYKFKDAENEAQYDPERKWKQIVTFGALLTLFISCIGLFGLSLLAAEKRTKEIGIRKVLGATAAMIAQKLSLSFLKLVLLAAVIAIPAAALFMQKWLNDYPYRVSLQWWMYGTAAALIFMIALLTISFHSLRAAMANPAKNLRTD